MAFLRSLSNEPAYKPARNAALEYYRSHAEDNEWVRQNYFPNQATLFSENFDDYPEEGVSERLSYEELGSALVELFRFHLEDKKPTDASPAGVFDALGELAEALPIAKTTKRALRQRARQAKHAIRKAGQLLKGTPRT
jgi:hypothetical protein